MSPAEQYPDFQAAPPPYGHVESGRYMWVPDHTGATTKQRRPAAATGASVLGIISGSLGIMLSSVFIIMMTGALIEDTKGPSPINLGLVSFFAVGTPVAAVLLLASGITFLRRIGYTPLIAGAAMQLLLSLALIGVQVSLGGARVVFGLFLFGIGVGLAVATLILLFSSSVKEWLKQGRNDQQAASSPEDRG